MRLNHVLRAAALTWAASSGVLRAGPDTCPSTAPTTIPTTVGVVPATQPVDAHAETKAEKFFREGSDALFLGKYDAAIDLLGKAAAEDPTKTSYRVHLARAYRYAGKDEKAAGVLEEILKANPDHVEAGQFLADLYARREDWKKVADVLEPLLKYRHDYPTYHLLAEAKYNLDDLPAARKYFEEAVRLNPRSPADRYDLGNIYLAGNFFALAADSYQSALSLGLQSPVLHYKLGSAYFNLRNYFGSITVATVKSGKPDTISGEWYLIEAVPGHPDQFRVAGPQSAAYQVAKAIADGIGDRSDIRFLQANIYLNAGRFQQASGMLKAIEPKIPKEDKALFYFYYAQSAFGTGDYDQYLKHLRRDRVGPGRLRRDARRRLREGGRGVQPGRRPGAVHPLPPPGRRAEPPVGPPAPATRQRLPGGREVQRSRHPVADGPGPRARPPQAPRPTQPDGPRGQAHDEPDDPPHDPHDNAARDAAGGMSGTGTQSSADPPVRPRRRVSEFGAALPAK